MFGLDWMSYLWHIKYQENIYDHVLYVETSRGQLLHAIPLWLCNTERWQNGVMVSTASILVWISLNKVGVDAKIDGLCSKNTLRHTSKAWMKPDSAQKLQHNFFTILQNYTNSPAPENCLYSLKKFKQWGRVSNITKKKFQKNSSNIGMVALWVWKVVMVWKLVLVHCRCPWAAAKFFQVNWSGV